MAGRTGSSNPNWKGGGSPERQRMYASGEWRRLRRQLRNRAACMCETCGSTDDLHMHHVRPWAEYPELRMELDNLMLLCRGCHIDAHRGGDANE
jgi:5-methylcytosine-specific restriction endonuclease McrA